MNTPTSGALISATKAAVRLGVSPRSVQRHFPVVRIGDRVLVRVSDVEAKVTEGQPLAPIDLAADVTFRLRRDHEKGGGPGHHQLTALAISDYLAEHPGRPLICGGDPVNGLAPHFVRWLKRHPPQGGGDDGEELRNWISDYPA